MNRRLLHTFMAIALVLLAVWPSSAHADGWKAIVHPSNPATSISKSRLSRYLLKTTTTWDNGNKVLPVDQRVSSAVRDSASRAIHGRSARVIKNWWNQQIFAGKGVPPPELGSDAKVLAYVLGNPGAVGYVDGAAATGDAKVITVTD
jgi:ABC-type phosphate transport system substrate-binding protein